LRADRFPGRRAIGATRKRRHVRKTTIAAPVDIDTILYWLEVRQRLQSGQYGIDHRLARVEK
jgi:hypothetical protein